VRLALCDRSIFSSVFQERSYDSHMKIPFSPIQLLLAGIGGLVMGTLYKYRVFPWLKDEQTFDHGVWKRTADMAAANARTFYTTGAVILIASLILFIVRAREKGLTSAFSL